MIALDDIRSKAFDQIEKTGVRSKHFEAYKKYEKKVREIPYDTADTVPDKTDVDSLLNYYGLFLDKLDDNDKEEGETSESSQQSKK